LISDFSSHIATKGNTDTLALKIKLVLLQATLCHVLSSSLSSLSPTKFEEHCMVWDGSLALLVFLLV